MGPVAVNLDTLKRVAKDFQLNEGMLKIVAQAMCFTDKQVAGLPNEAHIKVQGIRTGAEFAKYRAAAMELGLDKEALARARKCYESKKAKGGKEKEDAFLKNKGKKAKKQDEEEEELVLEIGSDGTFDFSAEVEEESESDDEEQPEQEQEQEKATAEEVESTSEPAAAVEEVVEEAAEDVPVAEASEEVEKTPKGEWSRVQVEGSDSDSEDEEEKE